MLRHRTKEDSLTRTPASIGSILTVAVWFGLLSGITEAGIILVRKFVLDESMVLNWHFPWMAPVASVLILSLVGACAVPLARWRWIPFGHEGAVLGLAFTAFYGPVLAIPGLATYPALLLTLGLAAQAARLGRWQIPVLSGVARRLAPALAGVVTVVMVTMLLSAWVEESRALSGLAPAPRDAPNVVLVVLDTVRARNTSPYGYARPTTPTLLRLSADGVVFDNALTTAPWTLPSHASLFTGKYPHEHGATWSKPLDERSLTLAEVLRTHGYATAGFSANTLNVTRTHGLARGFIHFEDLPVSLGRLALSSSIGRRIVSQGTLRHWLNYHEVADRQNAGTVTSNTLSWLRTHKGRPFFVFLNFFDAHDPYLPPDPYATMFGPRRSPTARFWHTGVAAFPVDRLTRPPAAKQAEVDAYDGAIAYMDSQLDRIVAFLTEEGLLDNTLLVVTADHGEQLGEHDLYNHGNSLYRPLIHVPLVMRFPGRISPGVRVSQPVSLKDVPKTVLDLIADREAGTFPGQSLAAYGRGEAETRPGGPILVEADRRPFGTDAIYPLLHGDMWSLVADGYEYIKNSNGTEELFDFDTDVKEAVNLANSPIHAPVLAKFRRLAPNALTDARAPGSP